jgi:hypothetical protein
VNGTYLGDQNEYRVSAPGLGDLVSRVQSQTVDGGGMRAFGPGETVTVWWHQDSTLVLTS